MHPEITLARKNAQRALTDGLLTESEHVANYLDGYEFRGDGGDHVPTKDERELLIDAIAGLIGDDEFRALIAQNESRRRMIDSLPTPKNQHAK